MKKIVCIALIIVLGGIAFAQTPQSVTGLLPKNPRAMGMGGAFRVFSTGYDTFFGNPAGFAYKYGSLTFADVATWAYFKPTLENIANIQAVADGSASEGDMASYLGDWIVGNGLGAGASLGLGWAGKGFGLGFTLVTDNIAAGNSLLGSTLKSSTQGNVVVGLGFPINLGPVKIKLGADARVSYLLNSSPMNGWPFAGIATAALSGSDPMTVVNDLAVVGGYGFAVDAGLTIGLGPFMIGAMMRDYGFEFGVGSDTVGNMINTMMVPLDGLTPYVMTPVYSVGAGFSIDRGIFAPSLYVEAEDPVALLSGGVDSLWNKLHAGAELELLQFIKLRAGLNKGWVSVGAGIDLIFIEIDAALFTEEMGTNPGDFGRTGIAAQVALRF